jgi:PAS domain S-box-containing protein
MTQSDEEPMGGDAGPAKPDRPAASPRTAGREAGAEARQGREAAAGRADLGASEGADDALCRANADLAASRAALREREERLRLVLDSAADYAIFTTGLDRRVTSWNAGAERLLGWAEGAIVGRSGDVIFTPEDRAAGAPEREAARALAEGRAENERWHLRKDGSRFWASGLAMPLRSPAAGPDAPPLGLLTVMRDRTERRRAEERRALLANELNHRVQNCKSRYSICRTVSDRSGRVALASLPRPRSAALKPGASGAPLRGCGA